MNLKGTTIFGFRSDDATKQEPVVEPAVDETPSPRKRSFAVPLRLKSVQEKVNKRMMALAAHPDKLAAVEEHIRQRVEAGGEKYDINVAVREGPFSRAELIEMGWFGEDGSFTYRNFITKAFMASNTSGIAAVVAKRPKPKPTAEPFRDVIPKNDTSEISGFAATGVYIDTYESPSAERVKFMRDVAYAHEATPIAKDPLAPSRASSRQGYEQVSMTADTYEQYMKIGRRFDLEYRLENSLTGDIIHQIDPTDFSAWFLARAEALEWAKSTIRKYRCALSTWFTEVYGDSVLGDCPFFCVDIYTVMDATESELSSSTRSEAAKKTRARGSALKKKFIRRKDIQALIYYLENRSRSKYAPILIAWLLAGVFTGLRPSEWRSTFVEEGEDKFGIPYCWLHVMNGKATNGRSNGITRAIDVKSLSPRVLDAVKYMSNVGFEYFHRGNDAFNKLQRRCSALLTQACRGALGWRGYQYSLYSLRHQFIANCKALHLLPEEMSAMAGHRDVMVAMNAYGRRQYGWDLSTLPAFAMPSEKDLKPLHRFTNAKATYDERYAQVVNGRQISATSEQKFKSEISDRLSS